MPEQTFAGDNRERRGKWKETTPITKYKTEWRVSRTIAATNLEKTLNDTASQGFHVVPETIQPDGGSASASNTFRFVAYRDWYFEEEPPKDKEKEKDKHVETTTGGETRMFRSDPRENEA